MKNYAQLIANVFLFISLTNHPPILLMSDALSVLQDSFTIFCIFIHTVINILWIT